jgi:hypothetical protein
MRLSRAFTVPTYNFKQSDIYRFSNFTPLSSSAGLKEYEGMPITFGSPSFQQRTIVRRSSQLDDLKPNSGNFDMLTVNETGHEKGRYLFTVFETGTSGVQRHDLTTGSAFSSPDNPAVDRDGNIYIIEDRPGGNDDDIWFAKDLNLAQRSALNRRRPAPASMGAGFEKSGAVAGQRCR